MTIRMIRFRSFVGFYFGCEGNIDWVRRWRSWTFDETWGRGGLPIEGSEESSNSIPIDFKESSNFLKGEHAKTGLGSSPLLVQLEWLYLKLRNSSFQLRNSRNSLQFHYVLVLKDFLGKIEASWCSRFCRMRYYLSSFLSFHRGCEDCS